VSTTRTTPTDPTVPPNAVSITPAAPETVPLRNPADAWALVVTTLRLTPPPHPNHPTDPARTETAQVVAGVWLPAQPPADTYRGDVVVRLTSPADLDPACTDLEVLAATANGWRTVQTLHAVDARWPHHVATTVVTWMRTLNEEAERNVCLRAFSASLGIDRAPVGLLPGGLGDAALLYPDAPDALAELIDAGLVAVGDQLAWNGHTATVCHGGALVRGTEPHELCNSAVSTLATSLATPATVNGWHLWRRTRDDRSLAELRADLARNRRAN